eukprot:GHVQ01021327.1.p1 GENE.GHVQ01021327.1~~GHVQ01021327.1.p1  ORF type:complete len:372 (+),score=81.73 GHVQ01021327.1:402-1517(+)
MEVDLVPNCSFVEDLFSNPPPSNVPPHPAALTPPSSPPSSFPSSPPHSSSQAIVPVPPPSLSLSPLPPLSAVPPACVSIQNIIASAHLTTKVDLRLITISVRNAEYNPCKVNAVILRLRRPKCTVLIFHSGRMMLSGAAGDKEARLSARKAARIVSLVVKGRERRRALRLERRAQKALSTWKEGGEKGGEGHREGEDGREGVVDEGLGGQSLVVEEGREGEGGDNTSGDMGEVEAGNGNGDTDSESDSDFMWEEGGWGGAEGTEGTEGGVDGNGWGRVRFSEFKVENLIACGDVCVPVRLEDLARDHKEFCCYEPELFSGLVYRFNPSGSPVSAVLLVFVSGKIIITGCRTKAHAQLVFESICPVVMQYQS